MRPTAVVEGGDSVYTLFAQQAAATPDAVAVIAEQGRLSYAELMRRSAAVCQRLQAGGLVAEQPVGVLMHRDADLPAVLLGIWKAGGCWVPFDPQDPPARVLRLMAACRSELLIGSAMLLQAVSAHSLASGCAAPAQIDAAHLTAVTDPTVAPAAAPGGSHLAYLLFTSGSTGEPKAVEVEHRSVVNLLRAVRELIGFGAQDRYLAVATVAFDIAVAELFLPLVCGGSLLLRDRRLLLQPQQLARELRDHAVTVVQTGPSVWQMLLNEVPDFPLLRVAISTGEAIAPELARRLPGFAQQAWNLYGPTEATVWATGHRLGAGEYSPYSAGSAPIGVPLAGLRAVVIDAEGQPLHDDTPGELLIGGAGVARGYRGNAALTQQCFLTLPADGQRYYRSGDLVVRDASGVLHYLGRSDDQLKIRGVRIEPAEVESALQVDARVAHAAVTWFDTETGARALVAAVVLRPGASASARDLHDVLQQQVPSQMIPTRFLFVPWLPMTVSGKVDRRAIRNTVALPDAPQSPAPALSETERLLGGIWQRMLGLDQVQSSDHFFSIGGDSLSAVQMMVEAEALFGLELHVQAVFEAPTLGQLAAKIDLVRQRPETMRNTDFVFPLVEVPGERPMFFCDINLNMARRGAWAVPCPLFAVSSWARGSGFVQAGSLPALVAVHLEGIRRVQPTGPYRIGGFSKGGLIAYELAQQLQREGEEVELLFLLDPTHPRHTAQVKTTQRWATKHRPLSERFAGRLRRIARGPGARGFRAWLHDIVPYSRFPPVQWAVYQLVHLYGRHPNPISQKLLPRNRWPAFWFAAKRMIKDYVALPYSGPVLAVFVENDYAAGGAWPQLLGPGAQVLVLKTGHELLFAEAVRSEWMAALTTRLQALPAAPSASGPWSAQGPMQNVPARAARASA